ncbi:MAG: RNA 2',3'-cyclic phosphodiesterase [Thermoleophilaceae bacterium]
MTKERPGSPRARLFVALDLPPDVRADLARWRDVLVAPREDLRPVAEQALHVTLAFLGYRPEKEIDPIAEAMAEAVQERGPSPVLAPGEVKPIPPRRPRLFALDLEDTEGACVRLQQAVSDALEERRFYKPEKRPFWPHITLARVKRNLRAEPLPADPPPLGPFRAPQVTLYRSTLRPQGAQYDALAEVRL